MKKTLVSLLLCVVMLFGMLPIMATAAGWSGITVLGFNYGDDGFLSITAPSTVGNYTYGTANGDTAAETAVNQSVLPESGWQWALKRESSSCYRLILNDFNITYSGNDDIMMSDTDLIIELRGSNSLVKTSSSASGSGIASNMGCTLSITGEGSLNVAGCSYAIYMHLGYTLTIESGNVNLGASYSTIYASTVELGEYVTAQSSLNSDGSNPSSFASGSRPGNYKWFQTVTNIPKYTLTFDANGGTGTMADVTGIFGEYTLPANGFTAPDGKQFKAWSVGGVEKAVGDKITVTADTTVTAVWEYIPAGHTCDIKPVVKDEPSCTEGGKEAYYKCEGCGKNFEDADGTTEIADIANWGNLPKTGHKYGTDWKSDKNNHWNECACGDKGNTAAHKDENADGKCDVCAYNVGLTTTPDGGNKPSDTPQTGDNTPLGLWIALLIVSSFEIVAITLFGKKKYSVR